MNEKEKGVENDTDLVKLMSGGEFHTFNKEKKVKSINNKRRMNIF